MKYIDQSAESITLNVFSAEFDEKQLNVIKKTVFYKNRYKIEVAIIGASHFVKVEKGNFFFAEVFACIELSNAENISNKNDLIIRDDEKDYFFKKEIKKWNKETKKEFDFFYKNSFKFDFPKKEEDEFIPITGIIVDLEADVFSWKTIHAYPNENRCVITHSSFKGKK